MASVLALHDKVSLSNDDQLASLEEDYVSWLSIPQFLMWGHQL